MNEFNRGRGEIVDQFVTAPMILLNVMSGFRLRVLLMWLGVLFVSPMVFGETMLQLFNVSWKEATAKMPELAEAGYSSLWLPPPNKGSGGLSVGYDTWDRFDLGSKDQRNTVRTRYGTEEDLLELMKVAHRFGIRVYFDSVVNHNAFDIPGYNASTAIDIYPGFLPEDFHLRKTREGFYRKWDNTRNWHDEWQVQNLGLADLVDIATEPGGTNRNHGLTEGSTIPKMSFVRHPDNPEFYCYIPTAEGQKHSNDEGQYVGFGPNNGITKQMLQENAEFYAEYVENLVWRASRWQLDRLKADGFRVDAVKHTPADFFGADGSGKDSSNYGYTGQVQMQFNLSRGFSDWDNHRDSLFDTETPRDDAMIFGEHLGQPPAYGPYIDRGMRLVDNDLRNNLNGLLGNPSAGLNGFDQPGYGGFDPGVAVMHAQSHDSDYAARRELQHAMYLTRAGIGLVYSDGNNQAEMLRESGGAFPRHANTAYLGQWGDSRIPNLLKIHRDFARGDQQGRWSDADYLAYERLDKREHGGMSDADAVTMLFMMNDNYADGQARSLSTSFPASAGQGAENDSDAGDTYLYQYARGGDSMTGFYKYASELGSVIVPPGGYFVFSPRTPEEADNWKELGGSPLMIFQDGKEAGTVAVVRKDGRDGDPNFNPYGLLDSDPGKYQYTISLPRVTSASDLSFVARVDGSAENVLFKLDGGIDLNETRPTGNEDPFYRDYPPALNTDVFLGYEQPSFVQRTGAERFAAKDITRNTLASPGAETYIHEIGTSSFTIVNGPLNANSDSDTDDGNQAAFLYHDPEAVVGGTPSGGWPGGSAPMQYEEDSSTISLWAKPNSVGGGFKMWCYYTTDGTNPEGAVGRGVGTTKVVEMNYSHNEGVGDWWATASLPKPEPEQELRYKIGIHKVDLSSVYPSGEQSVERKKKMVTEFAVNGFDAASVVYAPHNDYGESATGLEEGFHVIRARAFLQRDGKSSLYNTFLQTFYYDAERPQGEIAFPAQDNDTVGGGEYGVVVRTDKTVTGVSYRILDSDPTNDDEENDLDNGNGAWVEALSVTPNAQVTPSNPDFVKEWRFNYVNIPSSGTATIEVRLRELSSSDDDELSDTEGHFTTLTRSVNTAGPDYRMFVAFPSGDGEVIGQDYVVKVNFSKSLADGLTEEELKSRFTVRFGSDEGWPVGLSILGSNDLEIVYNETTNYHALAFHMPNLYNDVPEFLHRIEVTMERPDPLINLTASRRVKAAPISRPQLKITSPSAFDQNGKPRIIVLPEEEGDLPLEYTIQVQTGMAADAVDLAFEQGVGVFTPVDFNTETEEIDPLIDGPLKIWEFIWEISEPGIYEMIAATEVEAEIISDTTRVRVMTAEEYDEMINGPDEEEEEPSGNDEEEIVESDNATDCGEIDPAGGGPTLTEPVPLRSEQQITIGSVAEEEEIIHGAVRNRGQFTDWTVDDLVVLDEYDGDGKNNQGSDVFHAHDGFDSSRDMVAFYARDGGDPAIGGSGDFYFRVDFHDLKAYAEEGNLDTYVVIDTGNPNAGEYKLPDEVDTVTRMRWEAVVAVYKSDEGRVYIDTDLESNTCGIEDSLSVNGVVARDETHQHGFKKAYFNSELDAVEFSISRQALLDVGWNGDPNRLNFQVFTTKDGTQNDSTGAGDIGGRSDIRDTIYDDWLASDHWRDQPYIQINGELRSWFNYNGPDQGKRAKVMIMAHGNEAISPGKEIQDRLNDALVKSDIEDGLAAGYYRLLDAHEAYGAKLGLHLTPTLASSLQWAASDPATNRPWRDGPSFNQRLSSLIAAGVVELAHSTFADTPLAYFDANWLQDNVSLSEHVLSKIYNTSPSQKVFWVPERIYNKGIMDRVAAQGFTHVFIDQERHLRTLFGRQEALQDSGYRINEINGLKSFVIDDFNSQFLFDNTDNGLDISLRELLSRKARSGTQDQIVILYTDLANFRDVEKASAYDKNLAWLASRPWIEIVGPEQVANDSSYQAVERGQIEFPTTKGPLWLDHATEGDYDHWWFGSAQEESLSDKVFEWQPGFAIDPSGDAFYGVQSFQGSGDGIAKTAWDVINGATNDRLGRISRGIYHASTFLAGWHNEDNNDLRTYSTGDFIYPDVSYDELTDFAKFAQSQTRQAARHTVLSTWAASPPTTTQVEALDIDHDGQDEYLLYNEKVMAIFESLGGRCVAAWALANDGQPTQIVGNPLSLPAFETEEEGAANTDSSGNTLARRSSAFKDWYADGSGGGTTKYVNDEYTASAVTDGWKFTSSDGAITKTISLGDTASALMAEYELSGPVNKLFVRLGLSPDLDGLLVHGQAGLSLQDKGTEIVVAQDGNGIVSTAELGLLSGVQWQSTANDDDAKGFDTVSMRNQAQTQQIELESTDTQFTVSLNLESTVYDADEDGLPDIWELAHGLDPHDASGDNGFNGDPDGDGLTNYEEWLFGTHPQQVNARPTLSIDRLPTGYRFSFTAIPDRLCQLEWSDDLQNWHSLGAPVSTVGETMEKEIIIDDETSELRRFYRMVVTAP